MTTATGSLARSQLRLLEFYFNVMHRHAVIHHEPDALSRLITDGTDQYAMDEDVPTLLLITLKTAVAQKRRLRR